MDVVSLCPLRVASLVWRPHSGGFALTVIGKATYELRPGELRLAEQQDDLNEEDNFWDDDQLRSVRSPSDLVPFKAQPDVVLVGQAFAPGKTPVRSLLARLSVGSVDKAVEVCGDRLWTPEGGLREGPPFTSMQLRYERAASGSDNPVGVRVDGRSPLPNLQIPGGAPGPIGFGPIAPSWPGRRGKLGRHAASFPPRRWEEHLVPEDLDASFFNVAPTDQRPERLEPGDHLVLENLHPQHARLTTDLPQARPRAFVARGNGLEEVSLTCDTLWIDTDRAVCTLTWRGQLGMHGPRDDGRVTFLLDTPARPLSWADIQRQCAQRPPSPTQHPLDDAGTAVDDYSPQAEGTREYRVKKHQAAHPDGALPFTSNAPAPDGGRGQAPLPAGPPVEPVAPRPTAVPPWLEPKAPAPEPPVLGGETLLPGALRAPARWPREDVPRPLPAPPAPVGPPRLSSTPGVLGVGPGVLGVALGGAPPPPHRSEPPPPPSPPVIVGAAPPQPPPVIIPAPSLLSVSNLAAAPAPPPEPMAPLPPPADRPRATRATAGDVVDLVWFDPRTPDRVRLHLPWQELVAKLRPVPDAPDRDEDLPEVPQAVIDRGDVFGVLTDADPQGLDDLESCLAAATSPRGAFEPGLALCAGDLELCFDEVETLRATMAAVAPFAVGPDKKLKEAFDAAAQALDSPFLKASGRAVEGLLTRLRDTFTQASASLPPGWLDQQAERSLVEQRRYQKRSVLGESWIRALLGPRGAPVPTYLPEALAGKLPLYARFPARLLVEVQLQQDQYESHPAALCCLALGRVIPARTPTRGPGKPAARS